MWKVLRKTTKRVKNPNIAGDGAIGAFGTIVLILFVGAFLYLVITGIPTIRAVFSDIIDPIAKIFNIR